MQRRNSQVLTPFVVISGIQDPAQWQPGGSLHVIIGIICPERIYNLSDYVLLQFSDVRDAGVFFALITDANEKACEAKIGATCVSESQFCGMASQTTDAITSQQQAKHVSKQNNLSHKVKVLIQGLQHPAHQESAGSIELNQFYLNADLFINDHTTSSVINRTKIGTMHDRPVALYLVELTPEDAQALIDLMTVHQHGINSNDWLFFTFRYRYRLRGPAKPTTRELSDEELHDPENACCLRQHGRDCACGIPSSNEDDDNDDDDDSHPLDSDVSDLDLSSDSTQPSTSSDNSPGSSDGPTGVLDTNYVFPPHSSQRSSSSNTQSRDAGVFGHPGQYIGDQHATGFFSLTNKGKARAQDVRRQTDSNDARKQSSYQQSAPTQGGFGGQMRGNIYPAHRQYYDRGLYSGNNIDRQRIIDGHEHRSTVMFRNIPSDMTSDDFFDLINFFAPGQFSFLYLRMDFKTDKNVGYAFVDFSDPFVIVYFLDHAVGFNWPMSRKRIDMSFATFQGTEALIERFRNSVVMTEPESYRPRLFHTYPHPYAGLQMEFPKPDNQMKLFRSMNSAQDIGLFTPGKRGQFRRGQYDLGNPRGYNGGFCGSFDNGVSGDVRRLQDENAMLHERLAAMNMQG